MSNLTYIEQVRYTLLNKNLGSVKLGWENSKNDGVLNWDTSDEEFLRSKKYDGVFLDLKADVQFSGIGTEFINNVYNLGIKEKLIIIKEKKHPVTNLWVNVFTGQAKIISRKLDKGIVSVKFNNSNLQQILKSRENEKLEIDRLTDLDGNIIEPLQEDTISFDGREINLVSIAGAPGTPQEERNTYLSDTFDFIYTPVLNKLISKNDIYFSALTSPEYINNTFSNLLGTTNNMIYINNSGSSVNIKIIFKLISNIVIAEYDNEGELRQGIFTSEIVLIKFKNGINYNNPEILKVFGSSTGEVIGSPIEISFDINSEENINLGNLESLSIAVRSTNTIGTLRKIIFDDNSEYNLKIERNSFFNPTSSKFIKSYDLFKRLMKIITGKNDLFKSEALSTGIAKDTGNIHGFSVRGFLKEPQDDDNRYKPFTTSLKDQIQTHFALWNLGVGIEIDNFKEILVIEQRNYFYNLNTTIFLKKEINFDDIKITFNEKYIYSGIEVGFEKGGDYDEVNGLDEPNTKTNLTTTIDFVDNIYKAISKSSADSNRLELARRKQFIESPTLDTPYDNQIMLLDTVLKDDGNYRQAKWQDHYEIPPTGLFSPDTATELRYSPMQMMFRHSSFISNCLLKYPNDFIRYSSSLSNSKMTTKLIGKEKIEENGNILNSNLENPRFIFELWEFNYDVDFELFEHIKGITEINGKKIQNRNGLIELKTNKGVFYGFIDFINKDKIRFLKANR